MPTSIVIIRFTIIEPIENPKIPSPMYKISLALLAGMIAGLGFESGPLRAALVVNFDASSTTTDVTIVNSQNYTIDSTSGNGPIGITYSAISTQAAGIRNFAGAGLRIRNQTDGGVGTALFGFDLGGSYQFAAGSDDDITLRTGGNVTRIDDTGTGTRVAIENAGTWFVSEEIHLTGTSNVDALVLDWFELGGDTIAGITNISGTSTSASTFTDITTAGVWIEVLGMSDGAAVPSSNSNYGVQTFQFNAAASAVPEPSSFALLSFVIASGFVARRKRHKMAASSACS